jgi:cytosine/adenosine deaminase-related metal-dependent hydrolase
MKSQRLLTAKWVLPIDKPPLKNAGVVTQGEKIAAVGPIEELVAAYPRAERRDFGRAVILPGFVDAHTHLEFSALRGVCDDLPYAEWKIQLDKKVGRLNEEDWLVSARLGVVEAVQSGITTIADITETGASLKAALELGLRGVVFSEIFGMDHTLVDEEIDRSKRQVEAWRELAAGSMLTIGVAPHAPYSVCPPLIKAASKWAGADGLPVCVHLAGSADEHEFVKYGSSVLARTYRELMGWDHLLWQPTGVSPVRYMLQWGLFENRVLAVHCVHVDEADIQVLSEHDVAVAHCPKCSAKLAMGIAPFRQLRDSGLSLGLGTDSPASNNTMDMFDEMRTGLLLQRGTNQTTDNLGAETFVRMATLGGAEALGLEEEIGSLEVGKQADLVAVDMSHSHQRPLTDPYSALVYTANQENVVLTMIGGRAVFEAGEIPGADSEEIMGQVDAVRAKLV